jgi:MraZ protein
MLRGNSETKVDEKGRLKIPASFKKAIDEAFPESKFFITSLEGKTARIYPLQEWIKVEEKFKSSFDPLMSLLKLKVNFWGGEAEIDTQGRILIPQVLREHLKMHGDVSVMGMTNYLEVSTSDKARQLAEQEFTAEEWAKLEQRGI